MKKKYGYFELHTKETAHGYGEETSVQKMNIFWLLHKITSLEPITTKRKLICWRIANVGYVGKAIAWIVQEIKIWLYLTNVTDGSKWSDTFIGFIKAN